MRPSAWIHDLKTKMMAGMILHTLAVFTSLSCAGETMSHNEMQLGLGASCVCIFSFLFADSLGQLFSRNSISEQFLFMLGYPAVQLLKTPGGAVGGRCYRSCSHGTPKGGHY